MKKLSVLLTRGPGDSIPVGTLAEDRGKVYFQYDAAFLKTGLNLSPFRLPFEPGLFEHRDSQFGPLPGLFDDSLPDGWGLLLMDRHFRRLGLDLSQTGPLDRLAWLGTHTMGALTYHPPAERQTDNTGVFDLHELARQSQDILTGQAAQVLPQLLAAGGSPGGARPKVLIGYNRTTGDVMSGADDLPDGYEHWIVKFFSREESPDAGAIEYAYSLMAAAAGIDMPDTHLFETKDGGRYFGVKRFDRIANHRKHVHTFGNMIQSNFRTPSADYSDLLKVTSLLTRNYQDVLKAARQMVFNMLAHNRDDHVKNFAFILDYQTADWSLSPAYDLLYSTGPGQEHTMTVAGEGKNPVRTHAIQVARSLDIAEKQIGQIIEHVAGAVGQWQQFARQADVCQENISRIDHVIKSHLKAIAS